MWRDRHERIGRSLLAALAVSFVAFACSALWSGLAPQVAPALEDDGEKATRFRAIDLFLDCGELHLAAYQVEIRDPSGTAKIVGLEGGEHPAFNKPPYYDPAVLHTESRVIVAAFSTADELPVGKSRVATIHLMIESDRDPELSAKPKVAADKDGEKITASATLSWREN